MPIAGIVPGWLFSVVAAATVFTIMFDLLVATLNAAAPAITATVLAYLVISALTVIPYVAWRRRAAMIAGPS